MSRESHIVPIELEFQEIPADYLVGPLYSLVLLPKGLYPFHNVRNSYKLNSRLMRDEDCNILQNLSRDEFREFRTLVIDMVLATDMSFHFQQLKNMRSLLSLAEPGVDKSKAVSLVLHCCDISHPAKVYTYLYFLL